MSKSQEYVRTNEAGQKVLTEVGREAMRDVVTNVEDDVYCFQDNIPSRTSAAAMTRLSRRGDDLRLTYAEEFSDPEEAKDEKLMQRVLAQYGDDSPKQLVVVPGAVENASQLLTKQIERGRPGSAYLEQSTRYIFYDEKDEEGRYRFIIPEELDDVDPEIKTAYVENLNEIFENYSSLVHQLTEKIRQEQPHVPDTDSEQSLKGQLTAWKSATRAQACDAARQILPVATKSTVGFSVSGQAAERMILRLLSHDLAEMRTCGQKLLNEARKNIGVFLQQVDLPERGGATMQYHREIRDEMKALADRMLPEFKAQNGRSRATLLGSNYTDELNLVPEMLYEFGSLPLRELEYEIKIWGEKQKLEVFDAYFGNRMNRRHKPGRALEKLQYYWDMTCDYGMFRDMQRHRIVDDFSWQILTPYIGRCETPAIIDANKKFKNLYETSFNKSEQIYEIIKDNIDRDAAQYVTLLGHLMNWKMTINARAAFHIHELRTSPQGHSNYRKLVQSMHRQIADIHPRLAKKMIFVNKGEDPELTRLSAENYAQSKLAALLEKN